MGWQLCCEQLLDALRVEPQDHVAADHDGRRHVALVLRNQLFDGVRVAGDVAVLKIGSSRREEGLEQLARRSARIGEDDHVLRLHVRSDSPAARAAAKYQCPPKTSHRDTETQSGTSASLSWFDAFGMGLLVAVRFSQGPPVENRDSRDSKDFFLGVSVPLWQVCFGGQSLRAPQPRPRHRRRCRSAASWLPGRWWRR